MSAGYHPGIGCFSHKGSAKGAPPISGSGCTSHKVYKKESSPLWEVHLMGATRRLFFCPRGGASKSPAALSNGFSNLQQLAAAARRFRHCPRRQSSEFNRPQPQAGGAAGAAGAVGAGSWDAPVEASSGTGTGALRIHGGGGPIERRAGGAAGGGATLDQAAPRVGRGGGRRAAARARRPCGAAQRGGLL